MAQNIVNFSGENTRDGEFGTFY